MKKYFAAFILSAVAFPVWAQVQNVNTASPEQVRAYVEKFVSHDGSASLQEKIESARDRATQIITIQACYKGYDPYRLLSRWLMPGRDPALTINSTMFHLTYHDKNTCMSVDRIDNFSEPAKNALSYRVVFVSDSSGESRNFNYTLVRQSDGEWLILNAGR